MTKLTKEEETTENYKQRRGVREKRGFKSVKRKRKPHGNQWMKSKMKKKKVAVMIKEDEGKRKSEFWEEKRNEGSINKDRRSSLKKKNIINRKP